MSATAPHAAAAVKPAPRFTSRLPKLTDQPWWTEADQAELDALLAAWVDGAFEHKDRCTVCSAGDVCEHVLSAWEAVWEFREQRVRVSKAQWLRVMNDAGLRA